MAAGRDSHRLTFALAGSLLLHFAVSAYLASRPRHPPPEQSSVAVEFEIVREAPRPPTLPPLAVAPKKTPSVPAPTVKRATSSAVRKPSAAAQESPAPPPQASEPQPMTGASAPAELSSDLPRRGPELTADSTTPSGFVVEKAFNAREAIGQGSAGSSRPPAETKQQEAAAVKQQVDNFLGDAQREHRLASVGVDSAVVEFGRSFERAAIAREIDKPTQTWIKKAFDSYFDELKHVSRRFEAPRTGGRDAAWEDQKAAAREMLAHSSATYAVLVEVRQGSDGGLLDLRLLASSGAHVFDARALGSVVQGLAATPFAPDSGGLGPGRLSLWALTGDKISDSTVVRGAQAAFRYALLDVVPLKETVIELDSGGRTEQLKYTARLIAVY